MAPLFFLPLFFFLFFSVLLNLTPNWKTIFINISGLRQSTDLVLSSNQSLCSLVPFILFPFLTPILCFSLFLFCVLFISLCCLNFSLFIPTNAMRLMILSRKLGNLNQLRISRVLFVMVIDL